ncbi:DUF2066 domain-containing protein [Gilvimarinus agarilyticus]|uniref:DUF2066 domain-containing protein n=1 Tax=Gilvimarinus sp. 2_MG-2023 TaxID=3062666 RepID=UPI001C093B91|nr:DUF2066 domain-containing protein [Gilvimarinus sp. 2_MG-2023]MBU2886847.1 DUF2066 domain-containing protein [Gilvimarinus agarilyticus]MDO6571508.1 DUF2066 domain-containing protein [Gilvimarinus sp. 2_MG-2023]
MTLYPRFLTLALLTFLIVAPAGADQTVELYRAQELVKSQSAAQRAAAAKHALERVVVRVSGSLESLQSPAIKAALTNAQEYVYEYSYAASDETLESISGESIPASALNLKFSAALIEQLLREAGLPYWPANRPNVLIWAVANEGDGLQLVTDPDAWQQVREQAQLRGLPVTSPVFDLEDHLAMSEQTLWQLDSSQIRQASERYSADAIIALRYSELSDGRYRGNWQLLHGEGDVMFDGQADAPGDLLQQAVDTIADRFANIYAIRPSESGSASIAMFIANANSFADFKRIESYLNSLAVVRRVEMHQVSSQGLTLKLFTDGDVTQLENTLALKKMLLPVSGTSLSGNRYQVRGSLLRPLRYRLQQSLTQGGEQ